MRWLLWTLFGVSLGFAQACGGATQSPSGTFTTARDVETNRFVLPFTVDPAELTLFESDVQGLDIDFAGNSFWRESGSTRVDNRFAALRQSDIEWWLPRYEEWGRIAGYMRTFESAFPQEGSITSEVGVYRTVQGAKNSWGPSLERLQKAFCDRNDSDSESIKCGEVEGGSLASDTFRFHEKRKPKGFSFFGSGAEYFTIIFREGNVVGSVSWSAKQLDELTFRMEIEHLVRDQVARIHDATNVAIEPTTEN